MRPAHPHDDAIGSSSSRGLQLPQRRTPAREAKQHPDALRAHSVAADLFGKRLAVGGSQRTAAVARATPELPCVCDTGSRPQVELATSVDRAAPPRLAPIARTQDARLRASAVALLRTLQCGVVRVTTGACVQQSVVVDSSRTCAQEVRGVSVRVASEPQQNVARIHLCV